MEGKVHYIHQHAHEFETACERLIASIGEEYVVRVIVGPSAYIHPVNEELRGITVLVTPDTPVNAHLVRATLGTGTSWYPLSGMSGGEEISVERLRESDIAFNSCVRECCPKEHHFKLFSSDPHDWEPVLGTDCVDEICVARQYSHTKRQYYWTLFVTSGLHYGAAELLTYAESEEWTVRDLFRSKEYERLMRVAAVNRDRVAYAAASSLDVVIPATAYERVMTATAVSYSRPTFSALHHTIIEKELDKATLYAVHMDTFPLHLYKKLPLRIPSTQLITIYEPDGDAGHRSWQNMYANSFPANCGLRRHEELRGVLASWSPATAHGDEHCSKNWESMISYNLHSINEAHKPWDRVQPGLREMGLNNHWHAHELEVVMIKVASMEEEHLTAFELLRTCVDDTVRVPIYSRVFQGGADYKGFWGVYRLEDPPPAQILAHYVPGYVNVKRIYVERVAYANGEIDELYTSSSSSDSDHSDDDDDDDFSDDDDDNGDIVL